MRVSNSVTEYHYTDSHEAKPPAGDDRSPEQWARATFERAPRPVRWFLLAGWRTVLGLRLGPYPSPEHVLGWRIVERAPDSITIELRSWLMTARQVFRTEQSRVTQATLVRYERRIAAVIWPPVSILHRQIVPRCLRAAAVRAAGASQVASRDPHAPAEHQNAYESNDRHPS